MGLMIFLPLPLGNVLPNMSLELLSLGWMFHDGLVLLASAMVGSGAVAFAAALGHLVWEALAVAHGWWGWTSPLPMGRSGSTPAGTRLGPARVEQHASRRSAFGRHLLDPRPTISGNPQNRGQLITYVNCPRAPAQATNRGTTILFEVRSV